MKKIKKYLNNWIIYLVSIFLLTYILLQPLGSLIVYTYDLFPKSPECQAGQCTANTVAPLVLIALGFGLLFLLIAFLLNKFRKS